MKPWRIIVVLLVSESSDLLDGGCRGGCAGGAGFEEW